MRITERYSSLWEESSKRERFFCVVHCSTSRDLSCFEAVQALLERVVAAFPQGCLEVSVSISEQISDGDSPNILNSGQKLENLDEGCPDGSVQQE
jgi:hypothetical protein